MGSWVLINARWYEVQLSVAYQVGRRREDRAMDILALFRLTTWRYHVMDGKEGGAKGIIMHRLSP